MGKLTKKKSDVNIQTVDFNELVGSIATLYPCPNFPNQFQLGEVIFEAVEDENDGYRSTMQEVRIIGRKATASKPLAEVRIENDTASDEYARMTGYKLVDKKDGRIWLRFGTNNMDDYYPCFIFQWIPKADEYDNLKKLILK